jgi:hypothetical protein
MALTYPVKIQFAEYSGTAIDWDESEDWSEYLVEAPMINRRVESENEGEAGVIVFDNASVTFRYDPGNPIHDVFNIDLSEKQRYLFRISAPKSDKSYVVLFEGMADFSTITWPGDEPVISFEIIDKLSALGVLNAVASRVKGTLDSRVLAEQATTDWLYYLKSTNYTGYMFLIPFSTSGGWLTFSNPIVNPGEVIAFPVISGEEVEYVNCIVKTSVIDTVTFPDPIGELAVNKLTVVEAKPIDASINSGLELGDADKPTTFYEKEVYGVDINNVSGGALQSIDGLKVIQSLYNQAWPGATLTLKPSSLTYPIPSEYALRMIDNNPLGGTPLEAIKTLSESMNPAANAQTGCYIYVNREGNLVIHSKHSTGIAGASYTQTLGTTKVFSTQKRYFWDKLIDGAEVTVKSWLENDGEYFEGKISKTKTFEGSGFIKPKNELTKELLVDEQTLTDLSILKVADGTLDGTGAGITSGDQEEILIHIASYLADKYLEFYGKRRAAYDVTYKLDDNTLLWELVDNITIDSVPYFFTSLEMDLVDRTVSLTLAEVEGHPFDFRQVSVGLSEGNSVSVSSGGSGSSSGITNISNEKNIVYVSDSVTNKATALTSALLAAKNKTLMLTQSLYEISSKIEVDLGGSDIEITSRFGSKIYLTNTTSNSTYQIPEGNLIIKNATNVILGNIRVEGVNESSGSPILPQLAQGDGLSSLCNIVIQDCTNVLIDNCEITKATYCGVRVLDCDRITIRNSNIDYNTYAGALINRCAQIVAIGNSFSYNGTDSDVWGYGISCSHRYGVNVDNNSILIQGNKCFYNTRKAIDSHGGVAMKIDGNHIKGFVGDAIGCLDEAGSDPDVPEEYSLNWYKHVREVIITNNIIENDLTWFNTKTNVDNDLVEILVGSFGTNTLGGGSIIVEGNIIKNCNMPGKRAVIYCFVNSGTNPIDSVQIKNNVILDAEVDDTLWGFPATIDGVIYFNEGALPPRFIDISGNSIHGDSTNCIKVNCRNDLEAHDNIVNVSNNSMYGNFTYPIFIYHNLRQRTSNNYYNNEPLPDMADHWNGRLTTRLTTATVATIENKDLLTINAGADEGCSAMFDIKINAISANHFFKATWNFSASAGNQDNDPATFNVIQTGDSFWSPGTIDDPSPFYPTVEWVGTGDTRTLRIGCPTSFVNYLITIDISSWKLPIWRTE